MATCLQNKTAFNQTASQPPRPAELLNAVHFQNIRRVKYLLGLGVDPNEKDSSLTTALMYAAWKGDIATIRLLLGYKADINACDKTGASALLYAVRVDRTEAACLLIEKGAALDKTDSLSKTALIHAVHRNNTRLAALLIEKGAALDKKDVFGHDALSCAMEFGEGSEIAQLLKAAHQIRDARAEAWQKAAAAERRRVIGAAVTLQHGLRTKKIFKKLPKQETSR